MEVKGRAPTHRQWSLSVTEASQVAEARRRSAALARQVGLDEERAGALALVVTEAGTNLVRHAGGGEIVLRALNGGGPTGVEVLSLDRGPGMANLGKSLADGYSTRGSAGTGLGAIRRQADAFDMHSVPGRGTAIVARILSDAPPRLPGPPPALESGAVCLPMRGEDQPGDDWDVMPLAGSSRVLVADGLGHGELAAEAAAAAVSTLRENPALPLVPLLERMHEALRPTRGAVAAVAEMDATTRVVRYAGVGNISAALCDSGRSHRLVSMNGTMGHNLSGLREFSYPWLPRALLILHSDGLHTRWSLDDYPGLSTRHPSLVAGVLYRDFSRGRDDVTVVVARAREAGA